MREIKFRGKRVDNGDWVYGCYAEFVHYLDGITKPGIQVTKQVPSSFNRMIPAFETELLEVTPESVGQFTGLYDKNGKEIYEGDIVNLINEDGDSINVVCEFGTARRIIFENTVDITGFYFKLPSGMKSFPIVNNYLGKHDLELFEVIGNIHDNPSLLEVE